MIEMWYEPGQDWRAEITNARKFMEEKFAAAIQ